MTSLDPEQLVQTIETTLQEHGIELTEYHSTTKHHHVTKAIFYVRTVMAATYLHRWDQVPVRYTKTTWAIEHTCYIYQDGEQAGQMAELYHCYKNHQTIADVIHHIKHQYKR